MVDEESKEKSMDEAKGIEDSRNKSEKVKSGTRKEVTPEEILLKFMTSYSSVHPRPQEGITTRIANILLYFNRGL